MNQIEDMRFLVETVDRNGFSAAAVTLGVSKQLVSRRIAELESRLGVQLLVRTTRRLTLTVLGYEYAERARQILASVDEAEQAITNHGGMPRGLLRISAPVSFGTMHISSLILGFMQKYKDVQVSIDLNDHAVNLVAEGYDMAIRIGFPNDSTLIARKLLNSRLGICASPDYLRDHPEPKTPYELKNHSCLLYGHNRSVGWPLKIDGKQIFLPMSGLYRTNNGELIRDAAIAGLGIAQLPGFISSEALKSGALVPLLESYAPDAGMVYAVHPAHRQDSYTVRAFTEYLVDAFKKINLS